MGSSALRYVILTSALVDSAKRQKLQLQTPCTAEGCDNNGAAKCPTKLCKGCCIKLAEAEGRDSPCEVHAAKLNKAKEKQEAKSNARKLRNEAKQKQKAAKAAKHAKQNAPA